MTLVVGHASTEIGFLVGDTLLTPRMNIEGNPKGPFNGEFHALKVQILDPRTAVGFATTNDATTALEIISATYQVLRANSNIDVCECLFKAYQDEIKRSERDGRELPDCDFLVLKIAVGVKRLWLITKEGIQERERAYIGDATEYKNLNSLRRPYCYPEFENVQQPNGSFVTRPLVVSAGEIEFQEVSLAMETLVQQRRSSSVGAIAGCVLRVVDARRSGELEYLQLGEAGLSPAEGRTGLSLLASNEGERGIGIYFTTGRIGFVLIVGDSDLPKGRSEHDSRVHWIVERKIRIELDWCHVTLPLSNSSTVDRGLGAKHRAHAFVVWVVAKSWWARFALPTLRCPGLFAPRPTRIDATSYCGRVMLALRTTSPHLAYSAAT